jgi:hypothetical protein
MDEYRDLAFAGDLEDSPNFLFVDGLAHIVEREADPDAPVV